MLAATYNDLECQYYVVPARVSGGDGGAFHEYGFQEPDIPGLTKAGFIKIKALGLILEAGTAGPGGGDMVCWCFHCNWKRYLPSPSLSLKTVYLERNEYDDRLGTKSIPGLLSLYFEY